MFFFVFLFVLKVNILSSRKVNTSCLICSYLSGGNILLSVYFFFLQVLVIRNNILNFWLFFSSKTLFLDFLIIYEFFFKCSIFWKRMLFRKTFFLIVWKFVESIIPKIKKQHPKLMYCCISKLFKLSFLFLCKLFGIFFCVCLVYLNFCTTKYFFLIVNVHLRLKILCAEI